MFFNNLSIFFLTLLYATYTSFVHAMNPMAKNPDDVMQSPIVGLLRSINNQENNRDRLHCLIKWIAAKDNNTINAKSQIGHGNTPLHEAIWQRHSVETIKLLLFLGADITKINEWHQTPLEYACFYSCPCNNCISSITLLAKHERENQTVVEKNKQKNGTNPLHCLMRNKEILHVETLTILTSHLINAGYSINAQDEFGSTPVHYALTKYLKPTLYLIPLLNQYKANFVTKNKQNKAPFEFAVGYFAFFEKCEKMEQKKPDLQITIIVPNMPSLKISYE